MSLKIIRILSIATALFLASGCEENEIPNAVFEAEVFDTPVNSGVQGPATPGDSYSFTFDATTDQKITFASMYISSNDLIFTTIENGIELYKDGEALSGEITNRIILVDIGTEQNQVIGVGSDQADRQAFPNTGEEDENILVRLYDGDDSQEVEDILRVTLTNNGAQTFTVTVQVLQTSMTSLAPGVFAVFSGEENPIFSLGSPDRGHGLEGLAEDGLTAKLITYLKSLI